MPGPCPTGRNCQVGLNNWRSDRSDPGEPYGPGELVEVREGTNPADKTTYDNALAWQYAPNASGTLTSVLVHRMAAVRSLTRAGGPSTAQIRPDPVSAGGSWRSGR
jgi:hypothetical protein